VGGVGGEFGYNRHSIYSFRNRRKKIRAENVIRNTNGDPPSGMCSTRADVAALIESNALST
jgi:hypothetical protein